MQTFRGPNNSAETRIKKKNQPDNNGTNIFPIRKEQIEPNLLEELRSKID